MSILRYALTGPRPVIVGMLALAVWLAALAVTLNNPLAAWQWLDLYNREQWIDVEKSMPAFYDASVVTYYAACADGGGEPYRANGCDAFWAGDQDGRTPLPYVFNYPPIWLNASRLGLTPGTTIAVGAALSLSTIFALAAIFRPRTPLGGTITLAAVLSPPVLFGLELANSDFLIFSLLVFLVLGTAGLSVRTRDTVRAVFIVIFSVLKFYPIAIVVILLKRSASIYLVVATVAAATALILWSSGDRMLDIFNNTPKFGYVTFGSITALLRVQENTGDDIEHAGLYSLLASVFVLGVASVYALMNNRKEWPRLWRPLSTAGPFRDLALSGMAVYVLCFLLGSNLDYRLIFLVGVVPLFLKSYEESLDRVDLVFPLFIVSFMWLSRFGQSYFLDQLLAWLIFAAASVGITMAIVPGLAGWRYLPKRV